MLFSPKSFLMSKDGQYDEAYNLLSEFLKIAVARLPCTILIDRYLSQVRSVLALRAMKWGCRVEENLLSGKVLREDSLTDNDRFGLKTWRLKSGR